MAAHMGIGQCVFVDDSFCISFDTSLSKEMHLKQNL